MTNRSRIAIALVAVAGGIAAANADVILTYTYHDLSGSYAASSPNTGNFTAVAVNDPVNALLSSGDVSRIDGNPGTAGFEAGFVSALNPADFVLGLTFVRNLGFPNLLGTGAGSFASTDADGDTISGSIIGDWINDTVNGFLYFNGSLSNVVVTDNGAQDDLFNGTQLGTFQISGLGTQPFDGAITLLVFPSTSGFFNGNFNDAATGVDGKVLPTPGALALLGLGGLVTARRRR